MLGLDGNESDDKPLVTKQAQRAKKVLKEVAIRSTVPTMQSSLEKRIEPSPSPSTIGSSRSTGRGQSSEYDTPLTSAVATPAESMTKGEPSMRHRGRPAKFTSPAQVSSTGKRKRMDDDELAADAALAQILQAEEYGGTGSVAAPKSRLSRRVIEDSDEDESMLSELSEAELVEDLAPSNKRAKSSKRTVLPARRARNVASDSLTGNAINAIEDSEEDSESEFSLSDSEDVDLADDDVPSTASATPAPDAPNRTAASTSTATRPTRRRRRRRMPAATDAGRRARWNQRRIAGLNHRVSLFQEGCVYLFNEL